MIFIIVSNVAECPNVPEHRLAGADRGAPHLRHGEAHEGGDETVAPPHVWQGVGECGGRGDHLI